MMYLTGLSGGLKHPISWGLGGMYGVLILLGASCFSNQDKLLLCRPFGLFKVSLPSMHGSGLPSNSGSRGGGGWSYHIPFLLLHTSPIKISSCCVGRLTCFNYLSYPWEQTTIQSITGVGWSCNIHSMVLHTHHCFAGPLACFRYIIWNIENEPLSLLTPRTQEVKWVIDACTFLTSQCGTNSVKADAERCC